MLVWSVVPNIIFNLGGVVLEIWFQDARQCGAELERWLGAG
jgi:hypothetical protein